MKMIKAAIVAIAAIFLALCYLPIKDAIFGVPYVLKSEPVVIGENQFTAAVDVVCNRFYTREIGILIEPPIFIDSVSDIHTAVSGNVNLKIEQGGESINEIFNLSETGSSLNSKGIWSKSIFRFEPIGSFGCSKQSIQIEVNDLDFSLSEHNVTLYVSRDRRP